jgi:hypothetical protein
VRIDRVAVESDDRRLALRGAGRRLQAGTVMAAYTVVTRSADAMERTAAAVKALTPESLTASIMEQLRLAGLEHSVAVASLELDDLRDDDDEDLDRDAENNGTRADWKGDHNATRDHNRTGDRDCDKGNSTKDGDGNRHGADRDDRRRDGRDGSHHGAHDKDDDKDGDWDTKPSDDEHPGAVEKDGSDDKDGETDGSASGTGTSR